MIKLHRLPLDEELQGWIDARAQTLLDAMENGEEPPEAVQDAYRDPRLKAHLTLETSDKCAYCESKISHVYWGDVEHIKPKSVFPRERLSVRNLTLVCAVCNNRKGNYWHPELSILDPFVDDPEAHLTAFGYFLARRPGDDRGRITVTRVDLNRPGLLERRQERIELLQPLADQYATTPDGPLRELLREELIRNAGADGEYALFVRAFLREACELPV